MCESSDVKIRLITTRECGFCRTLLIIYQDNLAKRSSVLALLFAIILSY